MSLVTKLDISLLKENADNPRTITDQKFAALVKSVKDFPQMLEVRPIAFKMAPEGMVVLGGNMRLRACLAAGMKEVPAIDLSHLTEQQQREFVIKDNVGFGEWEWDRIISDWPETPEWGLDIPDWIRNNTVEMVNKGSEYDEWVGMPEIEKLNPGIHVSRLYFIFDTESEREQWIEKHKIEDNIKKTAQGWIVNLSTQYT
jgi:hypothetical protein